jgi:hypothetical protein
VRIVIAIVLVFAALIAWMLFADRARDNRLSDIASEIAGRSVRVDCPNFLQGLVDIRPDGGTVSFDASGRPSNETNLQTSVCSALSHYGKTRKKQAFACVRGETRCRQEVEMAVNAVLVLSHEAHHLRGIRAENETQCYAVQTLALVSERLGSPLDEAQAVARHYLAVDQPQVDSAYVLPGECRDGGALDLHPSSAIWPSG